MLVKEYFLVLMPSEYPYGYKFETLQKDDA